MKKHLLLSLLTFAIGFTVYSQSLPSDHPSFIKKQTLNQVIPESSPVYRAGSSSCTITETYAPITTCDSGVTTVYATGACSYQWWDSQTGGTLLGSADSLQTGTLYNSITYYIEGICPNAQTPAPLPAQSGTLSGNVRGYFFIAPVNFIISALRVPTDASTGTQTIEIVRFNSGPPPAYSATTNDFVSLGYWNQTSLDTITTCIPVDSGDVIGIFGYRGGINSYGPGPATTTIGSYSMTLTRAGMQYSLNTMQMQDIWQEASGSISRVEMFYSLTGDTTARIAATVNVNTTDLITDNVILCQGDSLYVGGAFQTNSGTYIDSLVNVAGCDSVVTTNVTVSPCTGIDENKSHASFSIYPNPAAESLWVTSQLNVQGKTVQLEVIDLLGRKVYAEYKKSITSSFEIDMSHIAPGQYLLHITLDDHREVHKVIRK